MITHVFGSSNVRAGFYEKEKSSDQWAVCDFRVFINEFINVALTIGRNFVNSVIHYCYQVVLYECYVLYHHKLLLYYREIPLEIYFSSAVWNDGDRRVRVRTPGLHPLHFCHIDRYVDVLQGTVYRWANFTWSIDCYAETRLVKPQKLVTFCICF